MIPEEDSSRLENPYASPVDQPADRPADTAEPTPHAEGNPWLTIWTRPRGTVRRLVDTDPTRAVVLLTCLGGVAETLDRASTRNAGDSMPFLSILVMAGVLGPLFALVGLRISTFLTRTAGAWLGGTATPESLRTAIAWATVPSLATSTMWIPQLALFGSEMFTSETPRIDANPSLAMLLLGSGLVEMAGGIWSLVTACHTIAEVQGFRSAWRGLANILLAGLLLVLIVLAVVVLIMIPVMLLR
jgi:hypothetical protein